MRGEVEFGPFGKGRFEATRAGTEQDVSSFHC